MTSFPSNPATFYTANSAARAGAADTVALMIPCQRSFVERGNGRLSVGLPGGGRESTGSERVKQGCLPHNCD
jgi:hypothetical protein